MLCFATAIAKDSRNPCAELKQRHPGEGAQAQISGGRVSGERGADRERPGASPDGLPPLRDVIAAHGLDARKSLGQNFILDLNLTRRIARAAAGLFAPM